MVHSAYDAVELAAGVPGHIEAVASHAGKLLVATSDSEGFLRSSDCSLRIYAASSAADGGEIWREGPYTLERQEPQFWRRPPLAMEVSASCDLLLSLSEWVALHRLPGLETVAAVSSKTKGANAIAWDDRRGLLAVGRQKRLTVFRLDSNNLHCLSVC
jgi:Vam6/Vps39-like protein vacuolar protein sorting-associated protein 39